MKHKILANYLQRAHWWMMAHLEVQGRLAKKKATIFNIKRERLIRLIWSSHETLGSDRKRLLDLYHWISHPFSEISPLE